MPAQCWHIKWIFQNMELNSLYRLILPNRAVSIEHSNALYIEYSLIEQSLYSEIL